MRALLGLSSAIDRLLTIVARIGMWAGLLLVLVVCYDVLSRYFGVPKPFGLNSTKVQEAEFWLHTYLFAMVIGYGYFKQAHVRIDLLRDMFSTRAKLIIEAFFTTIFLIPFSLMTTYYTSAYAYQSFLEGEISKSIIGIPYSFLLKSALPMLFGMLLLSAISQLIKSLAGLAGRLEDDEISHVLGEEA